MAPTKVARLRISRKRHLTGADFIETRRAKRKLGCRAQDFRPGPTHLDAPDPSTADYLDPPLVETPDFSPTGSFDFSPAEDLDMSSADSLNFSHASNELDIYECNNPNRLSITHIELVGPQTRMLLHHCKSHSHASDDHNYLAGL